MSTERCTARTRPADSAGRGCSRSGPYKVVYRQSATGPVLIRSRCRQHAKLLERVKGLHIATLEPIIATTVRDCIARMHVDSAAATKLGAPRPGAPVKLVGGALAWVTNEGWVFDTSSQTWLIECDPQPAHGRAMVEVVPVAGSQGWQEVYRERIHGRVP